MYSNDDNLNYLFVDEPTILNKTTQIKKQTMNLGPTPILTSTNRTHMDSKADDIIIKSFITMLSLLGLSILGKLMYN
tara:strand:- start:2165 stop:2395 length:231 start_codon:yes stop_codon:yes gene_type:complete